MAGRQPAHLPRRLAASAVVARREGRVPIPKQQGAAGAGGSWTLKRMTRVAPRRREAAVEQ